jgi:hypothetical protein
MMLKPVMKEVVEELHWAMRAGPAPNPILDKITPKHIDQLLATDARDDELEHEKFKLKVEDRKERRKIQAERQHLLTEKRAQRDKLQTVTFGVLAGAVLVLVFALCWLFLAYQQAQYIVTVISSLFAFGGGIGVGRWTVKPQEPAKEPLEPTKEPKN